MLFPNHKRFLYQRNPLEFVICQVRFPTILRIDSERPAEFQEKIRAKYPLFIEHLEASIPLELRHVLPDDFLKNSFPKRGFDFNSADEKWSVGLTNEFLSLTTSDYQRWENFEERFQELFETLNQIYHPAFFTRVGLRYRDVIQRSALLLEGKTSWSQLLQPHIAGELANEIFNSEITDKTTRLRLKLSPNDEYVVISHGLARHITSDEEVYLIDSDFYTERRVQIHEISDTLKYFNRNARNLFRWCITDKLHNAMEPQPLGE